MNSKRWTLITLCLISIAFILIVALVVFIDPYFNYHKPFMNGYRISNERYQNPGIARNFDYDAIILGSSMAQNFKASEFDEKYNVNTIKLTYSGAYAHNFKSIMDVVSGSRDVKKILWAMDINSFLKPADENRSPLPEYLYDKNPFNDVSYIFNKDIIRQSLKTIIRYKNGLTTTSKDDAYQWYSLYIDDFDPAKIAKSYLEWLPDEPSETLPEDEYIDLVKENMIENIIPIIENNKDTEFYIFYPPYSIRFWNSKMNQGQLDAFLYTLEYITETLLQYDNVKIFTFQDDQNIILDTTLYKDTTHYNPDINSFIIENLDNPKYQVTYDNYLEKIENLRNITLNTDIVKLLNPYINEEE